MGVFSKGNQPDTDVKRNAFDGSFQNNLTMKMGYLYPCMCKEVIPGDTFRINAAFGLRFMPTAFPLQTKMKAHIDFFYVRNRNLWDKWQNYFTQIGSHDSFPVLSESEKLHQHTTGSLGDYLGLPSTLVGLIPLFSSRCIVPVHENANIQHGEFRLAINDLPFQTQTLYVENTADAAFHGKCKFFAYLNASKLNVNGNFEPFSLRKSDLEGRSIAGSTYFKVPFLDKTKLQFFLDHFDNPNSNLYVGIGSPSTISDNGRTLNVNAYPFKHVFRYHDGDIYVLSGFLGDTTIYTFFQYIPLSNGKYNEQGIVTLDLPITHEIPSNNCGVFNVGLSQMYLSEAGQEICEVSNVVKSLSYDVNALPFRAYEQIYNTFYRDDRNNPFLVDGEFDPNRFLPTTSGGSDPTPYRLHKRNWEQDFLTTALPSPQFGQAPLVGLTASGSATFQQEDGTNITSQLQVGEDGDTIVGFTPTSSPNVNSQLIKMSELGISINDLRGVNALQRYLETKMRLGLRYRDQIRSHFGVNINQDVLDMPEFIGSISQSVDVAQINQTSSSESDPLGSYAGQLSCVGGNKNGFQKYCDESGFIIGIISIVPVPCYSQLLPKVFTKTNEPLDYFFPEFNHLGMQPIKYKEVCPLQAYLNGVDLNSTFGYQRAWYDYLSNVDEIHGQFRTTLNSFILTRTFNSIPSLNEEFLTVDPQQMNDVFTVNEVNGEPVDTILGQIHFDITMMRPISRFGTPRLE